MDYCWLAKLIGNYPLILIPLIESWDFIDVNLFESRL
jgi:hypothetical protein